ncbi:lipopolysaccharide kinase InaA family protein [Phytopseudomonas seleniipraecipitans]|uniref:Lipopolysaccharide kinase (Kdo/WaaP) family protein n=1 Tax=Phytopseudomonas seleniipraecipitans TaxID=640205 RepID=A0A1G7PTS4_9GAMM|nr:lipopolysaccharide kinase InaA family protein [Pseudomonas seleniipraecipitans]SDF88800.1 Lipopolysaccharide kinase (Kdo/WaaP) family protein [Pseudomonas seleniipraecipitans]
MKDFIDSEDRSLLERHNLASFEALWALELHAVDEPNESPSGGWSSVYRLDLDGHGFYLKRQSNYLTRSLERPLGEPTLAREFRSIRRYDRLGIPAMSAAFYAERRVAGERRAVLLTQALDGWRDLDSWLPGWAQLAGEQRQAIVSACGALARQVHEKGQVHGCFYPKHIFLKPDADGFAAQLIDLEKTRPLFFGERDRTKDLEPLLRRANPWNDDDIVGFLTAYLGSAQNVDHWLQRLTARFKDKAQRP